MNHLSLRGNSETLPRSRFLRNQKTTCVETSGVVDPLSNTEFQRSRAEALFGVLTAVNVVSTQLALGALKRADMDPNWT